MSVCLSWYPFWYSLFLTYVCFLSLIWSIYFFLFICAACGQFSFILVFLFIFFFLISSHNVNSTCIYKIHNAYIYCVYYFLSLFFPPFFSFPFFPSFSVYLLLNVCLFVNILILWMFSLYLSPYFFILCLSFPPFFFLSFFFSL